MKEQGAVGDRLKPDRTKLWLLTEEIKTLVMPLIADGRIAVQNNIASDVLLGYDGDELKEVLINLVLNAIESISLHGTITIDNGSETIDGKAYTVIRVKDNGKGIAPENLKRVFEPFFSTKSGTERRGLGLSIC
jgi:two-component system NtrC family sensor kinase